MCIYPCENVCVCCVHTRVCETCVKPVWVSAYEDVCVHVHTPVRECECVYGTCVGHECAGVYVSVCACVTVVGLLRAHTTVGVCGCVCTRVRQGQRPVYSTLTLLHPGKHILASVTACELVTNRANWADCGGGMGGGGRGEAESPRPRSPPGRPGAQ